MKDEIRLVLPSQPEYGRIARITASGLALRLGFTFPEVEDLRLAIDELVILLLRPEGGAGVIMIEFTVLANGLAIDASTTAGAGQVWDDQASVERFTEIISDTVDVLDIAEGATRVRLEKHFKHRAA